MVPALDENGRIEYWNNYVSPLHINMELPKKLIESLDSRITADHIRAARALIDWSMIELAQASGLSLSTVRRLEDSDRNRSLKSVRAVTAALRQNGVHFTLTDGASIVLRKG